jgi:hypothetical protein
MKANAIAVGSFLEYKTTIHGAKEVVRQKISQYEFSQIVITKKADYFRLM